ncbi:Protein of unknown function [Parapedobacter composti]|uniref:DUF3037 domain-containing protein n=1 Tax=Parapedobacter composti TaxID=623281 RepID=A0A1I1K0L8_9SPHI|nr:DUF3037 domain-containing protein [Parapedobacter composti]SFC51160.1 Protein of unknown function [Parapedobacter composti]
MQEVVLFEYAVIRVVPRVQREEFLNVGVILYCRGKRFLDMRYTLDVPRLTALCPSVDIGELEEYLRAFACVCRGTADGGPIAQWPPAERFRWLTAKRSTVIQTSAVHPGMCGDPQACLERLFGELVL